VVRKHKEKWLPNHGSLGDTEL